MLSMVGSLCYVRVNLTLTVYVRVKLGDELDVRGKGKEDVRMILKLWAEKYVD